MRFAGQIGNINEARGHFVSAAGLSNAVFEHGGKTHRGQTG